MSFQIAMMAGMAAMTVAQAASQASQAGAAASRGIASAHEAERQNAIEGNIRRAGLQVEQYGTEVQKMGHEVSAGAYRTAAVQTDLTATEVGIQTKQNELIRRRQLAALEASNAIDLVARGGIATGQDSAGAISRYNKEITEEDLANINLIGTSKKNQLSFQKRNFELSAMGEGLRSIFADLQAAPGLKKAALEAGIEGKHRQLELNIADMGARAQEATTSALLAAGGKLFSIGLEYGGGGGKEPRDQAGRGGHEP